MTQLRGLGRTLDMRDRRVDGESLRALRLNRLMRQVDLAKAVDCRPDHLCNIEKGRTQPSDYLAHRLAAALKCSIDEFASDDSCGPVAA